MYKRQDEKMTGGDAASVREHVLSPEEYLSQIEFLDDDFEFQHKDGFEHVDTNFASQSYWKEAIARFKKNKGAMFSFVCILFLIVMALVGPHMNQFTYCLLYTSFPCGGTGVSKDRFLVYYVRSASRHENPEERKADKMDGSAWHSGGICLESV